MRTRAFIVIAAAALALAGCGYGNLVLKVDVLSYLDPAQKTINVQVVPAIGEIGAIPIVSDMSISLIDGLDRAAEVRSATLSLGGQVTVESGSGSCKFKLYLSSEGTEPLTTTPIMNVPMTFSAGVPAIVDTTTVGSLAVAELFTQKNLRLAMVLDSVSIVSTVINMTVTITRFEAVVLAGRKAF
jgi:hypothetical protein